MQHKTPYCGVSDLKSKLPQVCVVTDPHLHSKPPRQGATVAETKGKETAPLPVTGRCCVASNHSMMTQEIVPHG